MQLSASTNPPKQDKMLDYVKSLNGTGVDYIHADVMDGNFVTNKTFDYKMLKEIKNATNLPLDVHIMIDDPRKTYKKYLKWADVLTFHVEAEHNPKAVTKMLCNIRKKGVCAGLALSPETDVEHIKLFLPYADLVLVMSVTPGKSGQEFLPETVDKLKKLNKLLKQENLDVIVEVDGGVNLAHLEALKKNKVDVVVMGSCLFNAKDKKEVADAVHSV